MLVRHRALRALTVDFPVPVAPMTLYTTVSSEKQHAKKCSRYSNVAHDRSWSRFAAYEFRGGDAEPWVELQALYNASGFQKIYEGSSVWNIPQLAETVCPGCLMLTAFIRGFVSNPSYRPSSGYLGFEGRRGVRRRREHRPLLRNGPITLDSRSSKRSTEVRSKAYTTEAREFLQ